MTPPPERRPDPRTSPSRLEQARMTNIWGDMFADDTRADKAKVVENELGMKLALVPHAAFPMGAEPDEDGWRENEGPPHTVVLSSEFYIGTTPVTQSDYQKVMGANPAEFQGAAGGGPAFPVERVSWDDAVEFCKRLTALPGERRAGRTYRLPTEAEWEFACRAGTQTAYTFGDALPATHANFGGGYGPDGSPRPPALGRTNAAGAFPANNFGLFDVHGNVWEWCQDWYGERYYDDPPLRDPAGPPGGHFKIVRGGCWRSLPASCRAAYRNAVVRHNRDPYTGFRVVALTKG